MVRLVPQDGDAVVRLDRCQGTLACVLRTEPGPDQCRLRSLEEAVDHVVTFAQRERLRAWLMDEGNAPVLLEDFRVVQLPAEHVAEAPMRLIEDVRGRLRAEFLEMPGLSLTFGQVQRLCGVERTTCQRVLDMLVDEAFLCVKANGHYARLTDGYHPYPGTADLATDAPARRAS